MTGARRPRDLVHRLDRHLPVIVKVGVPVMAVSLGMALYLESAVGDAARCGGSGCGDGVQAQVGLVTTDGTALLLVVLWLVFVLFVGRRARRLAEVARRVADGDLSARVGHPSADRGGQHATPPRDELLLVGGQFDRMLDTQTHEQRRLRALTEQLEHHASHDALTGLANRSLLARRLDAALAAQRTGGTPLAVVVLDVDDFKTVNDGLGHGMGDLLLATTAQRLAAGVRTDELPARLVGDEFAVLLEGVPDEADALALARRLLGAVSAPLDVEGATIVLRASAGVVLVRPGPDGADADDVLRDADLAVRAAKLSPVQESEPGRVAVFTPRLREDVIARQRLTGELRQALAGGELRVHYQPYALLSDPTVVCGFEALVRWQHPERGLVPPDDFVPLAEDTGLIRPIGLWVLEQACRAAATWRREHPGRPMTMSVNLAPQQLLDHDLPSRVADVLARTGLPAQALVLELTETAMMLDVASAAARLEVLRALGLRVAIDDFGTGSSSLSYIHRLPVDVVKVDRAFTSRLEDDAASLAMVRAIIDLASSLGLSTVAEGVETPGQLALLASLGCDIAQGFLLSRPVDVRSAGATLTTGLTTALTTVLTTATPARGAADPPAAPRPPMPRRPVSASPSPRTSRA